MLVKPENLRGAANICSDSGKRPLAAMFGACLLYTSPSPRDCS